MAAKRKWNSVVSYARNANYISFSLDFRLNYKNISAVLVTAREAFIGFAITTVNTDDTATNKQTTTDLLIANSCHDCFLPAVKTFRSCLAHLLWRDIISFTKCSSIYWYQISSYVPCGTPKCKIDRLCRFKFLEATETITWKRSSQTTEAILAIEKILAYRSSEIDSPLSSEKTRFHIIVSVASKNLKRQRRSLIWRPGFTSQICNSRNL